MGERALLVVHTAPSLDRDGAGWLARLTLDTLLADGWSVTVVVEDLGEHDAGRVHELRQLGAEVWAGPASRGARADYLDPAGQETLLVASAFDLAIVHFWGLAERWLPVLRRLTPTTAVAVDSIDVHLLRLIRGRLGGVDGAPEPVLDEGLWRSTAGELNTYAAADAVFCVSEAERTLLEMLLGRPGRVHHVPLGSDAFTGDAAPIAGRSGLLYVGNFHHPPNVDAADALVGEIAPLLDPELRRAHPIRIVGGQIAAERARAWAAVPDVVPVGWVPELRPELDGARAFVAPLTNGAGVKTKVLAALAAGLPVVTTAFGVEGTDLVDGRDVLVAEGPGALAGAVERVVRDDDLWRRLSDGGRAWAAENLSAARSAAALRVAIDATRAASAARLSSPA